MSPELSSLSGFKHDVFVSYAHIDNKKVIVGDDETAWVSTLCNWLQNFTEKTLGERMDLWRDPRLPGSDPLTPEIQAAVTNSAMLLVVLSEANLRSEWCQAELEMFIEAAGGPNKATGRIFVVQCTEIERERWPEPFRELPGYEFFQRDPASGMVRTLGVPKPSPADRTYTDALLSLSTDLANKLQRIRGGVESIREKPLVHVYMAEVTTDIEPLRREVRQYLLQERIGVLPDKLYPRTPSEFKKAVERDLERCALFVQMLGPYASMKGEDVPRGYDGLQLEIARNSDTLVMRWRDPELVLESVEDSSHRATLQEADVKAIRIEEFKERIAQRAITLCQTPRASTNGAHVFVSADEVDRGLAEQICAILDIHQFGYEVSDAEVPFDELLNVPSYCHGLMVIHGACADGWVTRRLRECRIVKSRRESVVPVWALCEGPPGDKRPLLFKLPGMIKVDCRTSVDERALEPFISAVREHYGP